MADYKVLKPVFWDRSQVLWSGIDYALVLEICLDAQPARWLAEHPGQITDHVGTSLVVTAADATEGGYANVGTIVVGGLSEPFPEVELVRSVVNAAVKQAYVEASAADEIRTEYARGLRDTESQ